jgi:hypothetical protein
MNTIEIDSEYYCKLFIDSKYDKNMLTTIITNYIQGTIGHGSAIYNDYMYIFCTTNKEANNDLKIDAIDGFLFYPYILEVYSQGNISFKTYVEQLKKLIDFLRAQTLKTIPVCYLENSQINGQNIEDHLNDGKNYKHFM